MTDARVLARLDALAHEADLLVFRLERDPDGMDAAAWRAERALVRREVERLRDALSEIVRES